MSELLEVTTRNIDDISIVDVSGRMDAATSRDVEVALTRLIDAGTTKIVFNAGDLTYISSSGLRVILASLKKVRQCKGELALAALQPAPLEVIKMTGFDRIFTLFETPEQAIEKLKE
jgi:anti-sigma B factor antagonist